MSIFAALRSGQDRPRMLVSCDSDLAGPDHALPTPRPSEDRPPVSRDPRGPPRGRGRRLVHPTSTRASPYFFRNFWGQNGSGRWFAPLLHDPRRAASGDAGVIEKGKGGNGAASFPLSPCGGHREDRTRGSCWILSELVLVRFLSAHSLTWLGTRRLSRVELCRILWISKEAIHCCRSVGCLGFKKLFERIDGRQRIWFQPLQRHLTSIGAINQEWKPRSFRSLLQKFN